MKLLKQSNTDMREGPVLKTILIFALPIFLGSVFQQLYNMVDSIVVGQYVNADALAAVGSTSAISVVLVGVMSGFPNGASIVAAQFLGADRKDKIKATISTTLIFLLGLAVVIAAAGLIFSSDIMRWLKVPKKIRDDAVLYFRIYLFGMVFMALYNFFASFLRALGDSKTPLIFLIISSVLNIVGDLVAVIMLKMGVAGVAWATVIAQAISVVLCFIYVSRTSEFFRFAKGEFVFDRVLFKDVVRLGLPTCLQSSLSGLGNLLVQGLINSFGTVSMAAYAAANRMEQICNLPIAGISMSLSLFVGQNIGANNEERAKRGRIECAFCQIGITLVMSGLIFAFGKSIMLLFVKSSETSVIDVGAAFMRRWAPFVFIHAITHNNTAFLRGTGDSVGAMFTIFTDLISRMVCAYIFALTLNLGFMGIAFALPCGWLFSTLLSTGRYASGRWKKKAVIRKKSAEQGAGGK